MPREVRNTTRKRKTTGYESVERIIMPSKEEAEVLIDFIKKSYSIE